MQYIAHPKFLAFWDDNYTFLKWKNECKSTSIDFNIKRTFSSWVDFTRLNDLKQCPKTWIIWMNSNLIKKTIIKSELRKVIVWINWIWNRICVLYINDHNDQGWKEFEPVQPWPCNLLNLCRTKAVCPNRSATETLL